MRAMEHVMLSGFMGAGKSTIGPLLASRLGRAFVDLDDVITAHAGSCVRTLFQTEGEAGFRTRERHALRSVLCGPQTVIALGGGTVVDTANRDVVRRSGTLIYLQVNAHTVRSRLQHDTTRPLLTAQFEARLQARQTAYAQADLTIPTDACTPSQVCAAILRKIAA